MEESNNKQNINDTAEVNNLTSTEKNDEQKDTLNQDKKAKSESVNTVVQDDKCKNQNLMKSNKKKRNIIIASLVSCILVISVILYYLFGTTPNLSQATHYLTYLGDVIPYSDTISLSQEDYNNMESVKIGKYEGTIGFSSTILTGNLGYISVLRWTSNDSYSLNDLENLMQSVTKTYSVDEVKADDSNTYIWSNRETPNKYEFEGNYELEEVECGLNDENKLWIKWRIPEESANIDDNEIASYETLNMLSKMLKNPDSLQIHSIRYTENVEEEGQKVEGLVGIKIDYSAQNSFGGYVRDNYYTIVDVANGYRIIYSGTDALLMMNDPYLYIEDLSQYGYTIG